MPRKIKGDEVLPMDKPVRLQQLKLHWQRDLRRSTSDTRNLWRSISRKDVTSSPLDDLVNDPISESCGLGIHLIGEQLHKLDEGHTQLMTDVRDRVCKNNDEWAQIIDKRWRGIDGSVA
jgi:hypothetical protein